MSFASNKLCNEDDCINFVYVPPDQELEDEHKQQCPKIYLSLDILRCKNAVDINPTFTVQVNCLNIYDCSTQSWQVLKTFRRFMELDRMIRKEFPQEFSAIELLQIPDCCSKPKSTKRSSFLPSLSPRGRKTQSVLSENDVKNLQEQMYTVLQEWVDKLLLSEVIMFSPTICQFFAIKENLKTVRIYSGNQLHEEIEANTELQLRKTVNFQEKELANKQQKVNAFLQSIDFDGKDASLAQLDTMKREIEECAILLRACKLNLDVWLNSQKREILYDSDLELRRGTLIEDMNNSASRLSAEMIPTSKERGSPTLTATSILNSALRMRVSSDNVPSKLSEAT